MKSSLRVLALPPLFLAVALGLGAFGPAQDPAPVDGSADETSLEALGWMAGRWIAEDDTQFLEETWSPPRGDALVGMFRWAREGGVWLYELFSIEEEDGTLVFRLRHFDRGLEPWDSEAEGPLVYPLAEFGENHVVFENPERDQPRRFVYRRDGDTLSVRLEKPEDGPGTRTTEFRFRLDD